MKESQDSASQKGFPARFPWFRFFLSACAFVILIGLLRRPRHHEPMTNAAAQAATGAAGAAGCSAIDLRLLARPSRHAPAPTAEEVVANKLTQFAESRRSLAQALARRHKVDVPGDVERFFAAVASGQWEEIEAAFGSL